MKIKYFLVNILILFGFLSLFNLNLNLKKDNSSKEFFYPDNFQIEQYKYQDESSQLDPGFIFSFDSSNELWGDINSPDEVLNDRYFNWEIIDNNVPESDPNSVLFADRAHGSYFWTEKNESASPYNYDGIHNVYFDRTDSHVIDAETKKYNYSGKFCLSDFVSAHEDSSDLDHPDGGFVISDQPLSLEGSYTFNYWFNYHDIIYGDSIDIQNVLGFFIENSGFESNVNSIDLKFDLVNFEYSNWNLNSIITNVNFSGTKQVLDYPYDVYNSNSSEFFEVDITDYFLKYYQPNSNSFVFKIENLDSNTFLTNLKISYSFRIDGYDYNSYVLIDDVYTSLYPQINSLNYNGVDNIKYDSLDIHLSWLVGDHLIDGTNYHFSYIDPKNFEYDLKIDGSYAEYELNFSPIEDSNSIWKLKDGYFYLDATIKNLPLETNFEITFFLFGKDSYNSSKDPNKELQTYSLNFDTLPYFIDPNYLYIKEKNSNSFNFEIDIKNPNNEPIKSKIYFTDQENNILDYSLIDSNYDSLNSEIIYGVSEFEIINLKHNKNYEINFNVETNYGIYSQILFSEKTIDIYPWLNVTLIFVFILFIISLVLFISTILYLKLIYPRYM